MLERGGAEAQVAAGEQQVEHTTPIEYVLMSLSVGAAVVGWWLAQRAYKNADKGYKEPIQEFAPRWYKTLFRKWYVDEIYDWIFTGRAKVGKVRLGVMGLGEASWKFDADVIDGAVNGAGWTTRMTRQSVGAVGQVDHRRAAGERRRHRDPPGLVSRAPGAVGTGAVVCAGHGCGISGVCFLLRGPVVGKDR